MSNEHRSHSSDDLSSGKMTGDSKSSSLNYMPYYDFFKIARAPSNMEIDEAHENIKNAPLCLGGFNASPRDIRPVDNDEPMDISPGPEIQHQANDPRSQDPETGETGPNNVVQQMNISPEQL